MATSDIQKMINKVLGLKQYLMGGTDGAVIGNSGDRLKVDATVSGVSSGVVSSFSSKVKVDVLQTAIPIPSLVNYTTIYSYSGTGLLLGFNAEFNNNALVVRLQVDGQTVFDGVSISDFNGFVSTADTNSGRQAGNGIKSNSSTLDWSLKLPVAFYSNVTISARVATGGLLTRSFLQGIVYIDKET